MTSHKLYSIDKNNSKETDCRSAGEKIYRLLWNPKCHCCFHKGLPLDPTSTI